MFSRYESAAEANFTCNILKITDFSRYNWQHVLEEAVRSTSNRLYVLLQGNVCCVCTSTDRHQQILRTTF